MSVVNDDHLVVVRAGDLRKLSYSFDSRARMESLLDRARETSSGVVSFLERIAEQVPEKPDHWNSCGQCDRNSSNADDLLDEIAVIKGVDRNA